jgi:regulator of nucleoside diphosphate kinase
MSNAAVRSLDGYADEVSSTSAPLLISVPDAERLMLQSRFVRNQFEAEILGDLETRIRAAKPLDPFAVPPNLVTMNSQVILRDVDTGRQYVLTVVFPSCANSGKGRISVLTPLGSTLLGARSGEKLSCPISGRIATVTVEAILHQPEAAGNFYG